MGPNFIIVPLAALIPMIIGFVWYHPKVFGTAWMAETGMTQEKAEQGNMLVTFGLAYLFACFLGAFLITTFNHQFGIFSLFANEPGFGEAGSETMTKMQAVMDLMGPIGQKHLSFGHGATHGVITGIIMVLPILGTNALFEQKSWKYIWINVGYWLVSIALMGAVLCQYGWKMG